MLIEAATSQCLLFSLFKACRITISSFHYSSKLQRLFYNVQHSWKNLSSGTELNHCKSTSVDVLQTGQIYISQNYLSSLLFQAHLVVYLKVVHSQPINSFVLFKQFFSSKSWLLSSLLYFLYWFLFQLLSISFDNL